MKCASWPRRADTATLGAARSGADEHRLEESAIDPLDISKPNLAHKFGDPSRRNRQIAGRQDHRSSVGIVYRHDFKSQFIPSPAPCPHLTKAVSAPVPQPFTVWVCFNGPRRWWHTIIAHGDNVTTCWPCAAEALLECCPDLPLAFEMGSELSAISTTSTLCERAARARKSATRQRNHSHDEPARAALSRGASPHEDHSACVRRAPDAEADVRRRHPGGPWWRGIQVGEFEQRQLRAIREELNRAHAQRVAPAVAPTKPALVHKLRK